MKQFIGRDSFSGAAAVIDGKLYVFGSEDDAQVVSSGERVSSPKEEAAWLCGVFGSGNV